MTSPTSGPSHPHGIEQVLSEIADSTQHAVQAVNKRAGRDILAAIGVAVLILGVVAVLLTWFHWGFVVIVAAAIVGAQVELGRMLAKHRGMKIVYVPLIAGTAVLILGAYAASIYDFISLPRIMLWTLGLTAVVILGARLFGGIDGYVLDTAATIALLIYPGLLASPLVLMLTEPRGAALVATFVVGIAATDTGGWALGVMIGKHPFAPRISPKKSWEGLLGSFILSVALVVPMVVFLVDALWWHGLILAVVLAVVGVAGDLVESVIKRDLGIKDMGSLLPGHGGLMDRLDGYILAGFPAWILMAWMINA